jgi:tetratricopeptide (TPR) repeat protein
VQQELELDSASDGSPVSSDAIGSGLPAMKGITVLPGSLGDLATLLVANLALLGAITSGGVVPGDERLTTDLDRLVEAMKRRGLFQLLGKLTAGGTVASPALGGLQLLGNLSLDADEQERVAGAIAEPGRVDEKVVEHVETMLWMCKRQEDAFGPQAVLNTVLNQQRFVRYVLRPACPDNLLPRLISVYSNLCSSAGWYFFDLNNFELAWRHWEQARQSAHEAHDTDQAIFTLCHMSYAATWHGKTHTGLDLTTAAQVLATKTSDVLLRVCVADKAAQSYAADGQYDECMRELGKAQDIFSDSAGQAPCGSLAYYYNDGFLANHRSDYMLRLGRPEQAVVSARAGLALYDKSFARDYAFCTLHLGNALVQTQEIDEAATVIGEVADLAAQYRSARLVKEVRTARAAMQPWDDTKAVRELDERLVGLG